MSANKFGLPRRIPEDVKKEVRNKCGFGCVVCGTPIYDYAHIVPYRDIEEHDPSNIILLCRNHHSMESTGLVNIEDYRSYISSPFNYRKEAHFPFDLFLSGRKREISIGTNSIELNSPEFDTLCELFRFDELVLMSISTHSNELLFNFDVTNFYGTKSIGIRENNPSINDARNIEDLEWISDRLRVRAFNSYTMDVEFNNDGRITINELSMKIPGGNFHHDKSGSLIYTDGLKAVFENCRISSDMWLYRGGPVHNFGFISFGSGGSLNTPVYARYDSVENLNNGPVQYHSISNTR